MYIRESMRKALPLIIRRNFRLQIKLNLFPMQKKKWNSQRGEMEQTRDTERNFIYDQNTVLYLRVIYGFFENKPKRVRT